MNIHACRHPDLPPSHPGELLAEIVISATGLSKAEIARMLGVSRRSLYDILRRRQGVTPAVAVRLGKLFGNGSVLWLNMQRTYDLWHAERDLRDEVAAIPTVEAA